MSLRISSTRQAVVRGPSFTGFGKRPDATPAHHVERATGIGPLGARTEDSRTKPVCGSWGRSCLSVEAILFFRRKFRTTSRQSQNLLTASGLTDRVGPAPYRATGETPQSRASPGKGSAALFSRPHRPESRISANFKISDKAKTEHFGRSCPQPIPKNFLDSSLSAPTFTQYPQTKALDGYRANRSSATLTSAPNHSKAKGWRAGRDTRYCSCEALRQLARYRERHYERRRH